jgi:hypothetical protein
LVISLDLPTLYERVVATKQSEKTQPIEIEAPLKRFEIDAGDEFCRASARLPASNGVKHESD